MARRSAVVAVLLVVVAVAGAPPAAAQLGGSGLIACQHEALADLTECADDSPAGDFGGSLVGGAANRVTSMLSGWAADGAVWLLSGIADALGRAGTPQIGARYFVDHYERMAGVAMLLMVPLLCLTLARSAVRADVTLAVRAVFAYTPLAVAGMLGAIAVLSLLLAVVDWATEAVVGDIGESTRRFVEGLSRRLLDTGGLAAAGIGAFLFAIVSAVLSLVLWVELVIRARAIEVAVLFLPLGFAALVWPGTSRWCSRLLRTLAALILAQPVIVAVIVLGAGALGVSDSSTAGGAVAASADASGGGGGLIAGISMLAFGCLAPWGLWHLLSPIDGAADAAIEGVTRRPTAAVNAGEVRRSAGHLALQALGGGRPRGHGATGTTSAGGSPKDGEPAGKASPGGAAAAATRPEAGAAGATAKGSTSESGQPGAERPDGSSAAAATDSPAHPSGDAASGARTAEGAPKAPAEAPRTGASPQPADPTDESRGGGPAPQGAASRRPVTTATEPPPPGRRRPQPSSHQAAPRPVRPRVPTAREQADAIARPGWMRRPRPNRPPRRHQR